MKTIVFYVSFFLSQNLFAINDSLVNISYEVKYVTNGLSFVILDKYEIYNNSDDTLFIPFIQENEHILYNNDSSIIFITSYFIGLDYPVTNLIVGGEDWTEVLNERYFKRYEDSEKPMSPFVAIKLKPHSSIKIFYEDEIKFKNKRIRNKNFRHYKKFIYPIFIDIYLDNKFLYYFNNGDYQKTLEDYYNNKKMIILKFYKTIHKNKIDNFSIKISFKK